MKSAFILFLSLLFFATTISAQWAQVGGSIDGEAANDFSGMASQISGDGSTIIVGAGFSDVIDNNSGYAKVFKEIDNAWIQQGNTIFGDSIGVRAGASVAINYDGSRIVVGSPYTHSLNFGRAQAFTLEGDEWVQLGQNLNGDLAQDLFGRVISLNSDGTILAVGTSLHDEFFQNVGHIKVFEELGGAWIQLGESIIGSEEGFVGHAFELSNDGLTMVSGSPGEYPGGAVHVLKFQGGMWTTVGDTLEGLVSENFGDAVSINGDGTVIAVGSTIGAANGITRIYVYDEAVDIWQQIGPGIIGESFGGDSGRSIDLNDEGNKIVIGAPLDGSANRGTVGIFENVANSWVQIGDYIDGGTGQEESGTSVSIDDAGNRVAIGAPKNNAGGTNAGQIRAFDSGLTSASANKHIDFNIYPNPTKNEIFIVQEKFTGETIFNIYNATGQKVESFINVNSEFVSIKLPKTAGIYFVQLLDENGHGGIQKVIKE